MCMGLNRDRSLGLARPLADDIGLTFGRKLCGFFLAEVARSSFPNSPETRSHWS
jgi:hypothetical protein